MDEFDRYTDALGATLLMHEAGGIGGDDVLGPGSGMVAHLVIAHLGGDHLLEHRESAAEPAAFIRSSGSRKLDALDLRKQIHGLGEEGLVKLRGFGMPEPSQGAAAIVQADAVRKPGPRESIDFLDVVQELDDLKRAFSNRTHFARLLDRIQIVPDVMHAAARGCDDVVEAREIAHEQRFCRPAFVIEAAVRHRLAATGLVARINDFVPKALEQLERRDANFRKEGVYITGDK